MRSSTARLIFSAVAWLALGSAAVFVFQSEQHIKAARTVLAAFDVGARETADTLAELRSAEQAYVAAGQGVAFWMPKVAALATAVDGRIAQLRQAATTDATRTALGDAAKALAEFRDVDGRARGYIGSDQQLMAADVIFTESGETAASVARAIERARVEEHQAHDAADAAARKQAAMAMAAAGGVAALVILVLLPRGAVRATAAAAAASEQPAERPARGLALRADGSPQPAPYQVASDAPPSPGATLPALKSAAALCTDLGRVADANELMTLLARAADLLDASGIIVWLGDSAGGDLRAAAAHGYPPHVLARMPSVPRSADNAAAAAYRTGMLQIVLARPGSSTGALVAPLLSPGGCIGALSAEIRGGAEASDTVQAFAAILAAQLAGVLASAPAETAAQQKAESA